ncbi:EpsG family protein [Alkalicoccobacillus porphyridii]|uniref:EpsG family protein n=1 Tax=Alkalicoccobacillus porphyridii TaxID=2597270 RepID=A0A554A4G2_9BACI|nr:EpsG family protein [Alkalicoccobacillus porphyridii]TSB48566.1 EpsG family protein [Alkalicoccobacillus porphyridii]
MLFYWFNLFFIILLSIISITGKQKVYKIIHWIMFVQLYLIIALRDFSVGSDTYNYIWWFERAKEFAFWDFQYSRHEPGYLFINKIFSFIQEPQLFVAIIGIIPLFIIFKFIANESKMAWLSVYLFITLGFYSDLFNLFRQMLALSCILVSYKYLNQNKSIKFVITILIASLFHISALGFIIVYFVKKYKPSFKMLYLYFIAGLGLFILGKPIINFMISNFATRSNIEVSSQGGFSLLGVLIITLVFGLIFKKNDLEFNAKSNILFNILSVAIMVQILALNFSLFTRVTSYFMFFMIIFIPEILNSIKDKSLKVFSVIMVILFAALYYYLSLLRDSSGIVPYIFN